MSQVAGLLLAAGAGRRMGGPKALLRLNGQPLVQRAVGVLAAAGCAPVVVVLGAFASQVQAQADLSATTVVTNPDWETGMGSSLRAGLEALEATAAQAVVVILVDQPGMTPEAVRRVAAHAGPDALVSAGYGGRRSHPVLFGRNHWAAMAQGLTGDVGAKPYIQARADELVIVECGDIADDVDVDTPEAARAWGIA